ncbi:MAG: hypothetical protein AAF871_11385 [Pseudomonadota bacterium]
MIVWPGGTLAETRDDRYGFEYDDLYNPATGKPGLSDMMAIASDQGAALSVILPTARYVDDTVALRAELQDFLADLLGGDFGAMPHKLILEVGNEYFANLPGSTKAADYGEMAELVVTEIALALADPSINTIGADIDIAVQAGKTAADDVVIRNELSDFVLSNVDMITHHRFAYQPQGIDSRIDELEDIVAAWEADVSDAGGSDPSLFVSAWNTVTITRNGVRDLYIDDQASKGNVVAADDVDLDGRTTTDFEEFWQDQLAEAAYGQEHASYILESFASYAEAGMDAASVYGIDTEHPGHLSWREDGDDYDFVGAEMLKMIYESVGGTYVLRSNDDYDQSDLLNVYGFENDDKLVVFLAAGDTAPGDVVVNLDGIGSTLQSVYADSLTGETPADWKAVFDVADNPSVDESPEADAYAVGIRDGLTPEVSTDGISVSLDNPHDIIRLAFAKTPAGEADIESWADGSKVELEGDLPLPVTDPVTDDPLPDIDDGEEAASAMEAGGVGGGVGALLALLFFIF